METNIKVEKKIEISKGDFEAYEKVRNSGKTNMFDISMVQMLSRGKLTREKCIAIMENYEKLMEEYLGVSGED